MMTRASTNILLIDRVPGGRSLATDAIWIVAFSLVTAGCAQLSVHLPFTPVPVTAQTLAVLLSGAVLGWRRGFLSQLVYLAEGAAGLPVFADATGTALRLVGPSGGYLWSFPLAAALVGWLVEQGAARSTWKLAGALVAADALILIVGSAWLQLLFRVPYSQAWLLGFYPFLVTDALKIVLVGLSLPRVLRRFEAHENDLPARPDSS
ncbi:MAG: biotin transporter BioY [Acidobacteriia bacterium]|nr:biotin transporter BioY [Terriglobia bacterium]